MYLSTQICKIKIKRKRNNATKVIILRNGLMENIFPQLCARKFGWMSSKPQGKFNTLFVQYVFLKLPSEGFLFLFLRYLTERVQVMLENKEVWAGLRVCHFDLR